MEQQVQNPTAPSQPQVAKKNNKTTTIVIIAVVLLLLCCSVLVGIYLVSKSALDQAAQQIQDAAQEIDENTGNGAGSTSEEGTNGGLDTDLDQETESDDSFVLDGSLPSGFPNDVPIYPNSEVVGSTTSETDYSAVLSTTDLVDPVYDYYLTELKANGWVIEQEVDYGIKGFIASKGNREANIGVFGDETGTTITVGVTKY